LATQVSRSFERDQTSDHLTAKNAESAEKRLIGIFALSAFFAVNFRD